MSETLNPDKLIAGNFPQITEAVTYVSGQTIVRGALLGKITASGKYALSLSGAADGSETPTAVATEDCDASAADKVGIVFLSGEFNQNAMTFGTGHTAASTKAGLRNLGIYLKSSQTA